MKQARLAVAALTGLLLAGCPAGYAVWLIEPAMPGRVVLGLATKHHGNVQRRLTRIAVATCERIAPDLRRTPARTVWLAVAADAVDGGPSPAQVAYGLSPAGLRDSVGPVPLAPGCYHVSVAAEPGYGVMRFWMDSSGVARPWTRADLDSAGRVRDAYSQALLAADDRAEQACRRAYAAAATAAESAVVATHVAYDTTRFPALDCGTLRREDPP